MEKSNLKLSRSLTKLVLKAHSKKQWSNAMKKLISAIRNIRMSQVLAVCLAGFLMFFSTACSGNAQAKDSAGYQRSSNSAEQGIPGHRQQNYKGGMNGYSDVDARYNKGTKDRSATQAKGLVDNAERNVIDQTDDVGTNTRRILDKKGENAEHFGQNVKQDTRALGRKTEGTTEELSDAAERGQRNLRRNLQKAGDNVSDRAEEMSDRAASATRDASRGAREAAENVSSNTRSAGEKVVDSVNRAADNAASSVQSNSRNRA